MSKARFAPLVGLAAASILLPVAVPATADDGIEKGGRATGSPTAPFSTSIPVLKPKRTISPRCGDIRRMLRTSDGAIWIRGGAVGRVCRVVGTRAQQIAFTPAGGPTYGSSLVIGADGRPWFEYYRPGQIGRAFVHLAAGVARVNSDLSVTDVPLPPDLIQRGIAIGPLLTGPESDLILPAEFRNTASAKGPSTPVMFRIARNGTLGAPEPYVDPFPGLSPRRIIADGPSGTSWAASPSQQVIMRVASRGTPAKRYRTPRSLKGATWFAVGTRGRIWFGANRQATSWQPSARPKTVRIPPHPGLIPQTSAVLSDGRLVLGMWWRSGTNRGRQTAFILDRDGFRARLELRGRAPWSFLQAGSRLWVGANGDLLRFTP